LVVIVLVAAALQGLPGAAQIVPPPPPPSPASFLPFGTPPVGTGLIAGQVIDSQSGKPIPDTLVALTNLRLGLGGVGSTPFAIVVMTDSQGRFYFANVAAGTFTIAGLKTGYSRIAGVPGAGAMIELADGERVTNAVVRLLKTGTMSGTLRDETGDPVVGTSVYLARRVIIDSRPELETADVATSDDRGMFRFANQPAGDYLLCACRRDPIPFDQTLLTTLATQPLHLLSLAGKALRLGADVVSLDDSLRTYARAFYPNSRSAARATIVTLASGEDRMNLDITVPLVRAARVTGRVIGAQSPLTASSIFLMAADEVAFGGITALSPMLVQPDGRFDFANVAPGQYRLVVSHRESGARGGGAPSGSALRFVGSRGTPIPTGGRGQPLLDEPPLWADEVITVPDRSTVVVDVTLQRGVRVTGKIEVVGAPPTPPPAPTGANAPFRAVTLSNLEVRSLFQLGLTDGRTFSVFGGAPGKYFLFVFAPGLSVRSATVGGQDITDLPLELGSRDLNDVVITLTSEPRATLVVNTPPPMAGEPRPDHVLLVFPSDRRYWAFPSTAGMRYSAVPLTAKGTATIANLPAGTYFVLLVPPHESVDWMEPTRMEALSRRAQAVTVVEGEKKTITVR
jgi:hypothetical protein